MAQANKPDHIGKLSNIGNLIQLGQWAVRVGIAVSAFAIPAWAARAAGFMSHYAPLSWVGVGFLGLFAASIAYSLAGWGRFKWIRSRYDARMLERGSLVDPLEKTFERKRIYLNEFALPSHPLIEGKSFIDCEIIGPANIVLVSGNRVDEPKLPVCDTVLMHTTAIPNNGYAFRNCAFRGCSFQRITLLIPIAEYQMARGVDWLNWITPYPDGENQIRLPLPPTPEDAQQQPPIQVQAEEKKPDDKGK